MYDIVNSAFTDALKREGKIITSYSDNTPYTVLFRRNSDTNALQNKSTIYYPADIGIAAGQLLKFKNNVYLAVNSETSENDVYHKSDLFQTNTTLESFKDGIESNTPMYSYDVSTTIQGSSKTVLEIGGNLEMITIDNAASRALTINTVFSAMGENWKIINLLYKNNIAYIYVEQTSDAAPTHTLSISGASDSYYVGDTATLTTIAKRNADTVTNATISWTSSDINLATIDNNGNISFLAEGSVTFTALWAEHDVTATKSITISTKQVTPTYKWYWSDDGAAKTYITDATSVTLDKLLEDSYRTFGIEKWFGTTIADTNDTYTFHLDAGSATSSNYTATVVNTYEYRITNNAMFTGNYMKVTATSSTSGLLPLTVQFLLGGAF